MSTSTVLQNDLRTSCFDGYTRTFSASRRERIVDLRPWEPDISAVVAALIGDAGVAATSFLCLAANHVPDRAHYDYFITNASELPREALRRLRVNDSRPCLVRPDIFVLRINKRTGQQQIVIAVELKNGAWANYIDCPAGIHTDYSNQFVCYPEGCWLNLGHPAAADVRYVWLAPASHLTTDYIESRALRDDPAWLENLFATRAAYLRQSEAWSTKWAKASLEDLIEQISPHIPGIADLLKHWIERRP